MTEAQRFQLIADSVAKVFSPLLWRWRLCGRTRQSLPPQRRSEVVKINNALKHYRITFQTAGSHLLKDLRTNMGEKKEDKSKVHKLALRGALSGAADGNADKV